MTRTVPEREVANRPRWYQLGLFAMRYLDTFWGLLRAITDRDKQKLWDEALVLAFPGVKVLDDEREIIKFIKETHAL